ncbi:hypothetical protein HHX47_DHR5000794 [Lentinula edodes]|nr:hypothetical protein HHX47_DHR5000794 [Lentinula edodes]
MQPLSDLGGILDTASNSSDDRTLLTRLRRRSSSSFCLYCQLRASDPLVVDSLYQKVRMRNLEGPERRNLWNCSGSPVRPLAVSMRANCKRRKELMQNLTRRSSPRNVG